MFTLLAQIPVDLDRAVTGEALDMLQTEMRSWQALAFKEADTSNIISEALFSSWMLDHVNAKIKQRGAFISRRDLREMAQDYDGPGRFFVDGNGEVELDAETMDDDTAQVIQGIRRIDVMLEATQILAQKKLDKYLQAAQQKAVAPLFGSDLYKKDVAHFLTKAIHKKARFPNAEMNVFPHVDVDRHYAQCFYAFSRGHQGIRGSRLRELFWRHIEDMAKDLKLDPEPAMRHPAQYFLPYFGAAPARATALSI